MKRFLSKKPGFTLTETVIALAIVAVLLTSFIAVLGPARDSIQRAIDLKEADNLTAALESEISTLRPSEQQTYGPNPSVFAKAFSWIKDSHDAQKAILIYTYRAYPDNPRPDGTMRPFKTEKGVPGQDYITVTGVRRLDDPKFKEDMEAVSSGSSVFVVRMTQLVFDSNGSIKLGEKGKIVDPKKPGTDYSTTPEQYPEALVACDSEFFIMPTKSYDFIKRFSFKKLTKSVFRRTVMVKL